MNSGRCECVLRSAECRQSDNRTMKTVRMKCSGNNNTFHCERFHIYPKKNLDLCIVLFPHHFVEYLFYKTKTITKLAVYLVGFLLRRDMRNSVTELSSFSWSSFFLLLCNLFQVSISIIVC